MKVVGQNNSFRKKLIVLGCGFGGLKLAKMLKNSVYEVILIDRHNYHEFAPLFYQIASSGLEPGAICFPLRYEFSRASNIHYKYGNVNSIDTKNKIVLTDNGDFKYDLLVIGIGVTTRFFGMTDIEEFSYTLKTTSEGLLLRNQILLCLEKATECKEEECRKRMLTFVISGAGPAGAEIGGALGELKKYVIKREYPEINPSEVRIIIIEAADRVLRAMSNEASIKSAKYLNELEVEVYLNTGITRYDGKIVETNTGEKIPTDTLVWTAGVEGIKIKGLSSEDFGQSNRLLVDKYNRLIHHDDIYAIGDCCLMITPQSPHGHPQVAQVAIQQGANLAKNLKEESFIHEFSYKDKGSMATIGRNRAVVDLKLFHFGGRLAWWTWLFIHLITLVGIRSKIITFVNWVWNYFTYNSSLRIMVNPTLRNKRPSPTCESSE